MFSESEPWMAKTGINWARMVNWFRSRDCYTTKKKLLQILSEVIPEENIWYAGALICYLRKNTYSRFIIWEIIPREFKGKYTIYPGFYWFILRYTIYPGLYCFIVRYTIYPRGINMLPEKKYKTRNLRVLKKREKNVLYNPIKSGY